MSIDLRNARDWASGALDARVGPDAVTLWFDGRSRAVIDREQLREWLIHPSGLILDVDEVAWSVESGVTCLSIGRTGFYTVSVPALRHLLSVI